MIINKEKKGGEWTGKFNFKFTFKFSFLFIKTNGTHFIVMMMNHFCKMVDQRKVLSSFSAETTAGDSHHRKLPTSREQSLNLSRMRV